MKNFIKNIIKKINKKKTLIVLPLIFILFMYIYQINTLTAKVVEAKEKINILEKNDIRKIRDEIESVQNDANEFAIMEKNLRIQAEEIIDQAENRKKQKEESIWKVRCLNKNVELFINNLPKENCNENLERFASYNLVK